MNELEQKVHEQYCELLQKNTELNKLLSNILDLIGDMRKEIFSLRTDVDKLIENNQGGRRYGRTA